MFHNQWNLAAFILDPKPPVVSASHPPAVLFPPPPGPAKLPLTLPRPFQLLCHSYLSQALPLCPIITLPGDALIILMGTCQTHSRDLIGRYHWIISQPEAKAQHPGWGTVRDKESVTAEKETFLLLSFLLLVLSLTPHLVRMDQQLT